MQTDPSPYQEQATRALVKRLGAESYIFLSMVSFAISVVLTRLFLSLTGYPQIGGSQFHIAHVLWGGLLLFVGGLLPLALANAWVYTASAIINGVGMGLFIDEVGKFITQNNDYFYPAAAPIIYAFFLLTVIVYLFVRRANRNSPRDEMYQAVHDLGEVLDHDLDMDERRALEARLQRVMASAPGSNLALLAGTLLVFLEDESLRLASVRPTRWQRLQEQFNAYGRHINQTRYRAVLVGLMLGGGAIGLSQAGQLLYFAFGDRSLLQKLMAWLLAGQFHTLSELRWLLIRVGLEGGLALLLVAAAGLLLTRREQQGVQLGVMTLVMLLTTVNLLVFYFDQFSAVAAALAQYALLALLVAYRKWYLTEPAAPPVAAPQEWIDSGLHE